MKFVSSKIFSIVAINCDLFRFISLQPGNELCYISKFYPLERATFGKEPKQINQIINYRFKYLLYRNNEPWIGFNGGTYNFNLQVLKFTVNTSTEELLLHHLL